MSYASDMKKLAKYQGKLQKYGDDLSKAVIYNAKIKEYGNKLKLQRGGAGDHPVNFNTDQAALETAFLNSKTELTNIANVNLEEKAQQVNAHVQRANEQYNTMVNRLLNKIRDMTKEKNTELNDLIQQNQAATNGLQAELNTRNAKIADLERDVQQLNQQIAQLNQQLQDVTANHGTVSQQVAQLQQQLRAKEQELRQKQEELAAQQLLHQQLTTANNDLQQKYDTLQRAYGNYVTLSTTQHDQLHQQIVATKNIHMAINEQLTTTLTSPQPQARDTFGLLKDIIKEDMQNMLGREGNHDKIQAKINEINALGGVNMTHDEMTTLIGAANNAFYNIGQFHNLA